jgi:hypothetical protein
VAYDRAEALDVYRLSFEEYPGLSLRARRPSFVGEQSLELAWPVLRDRRAGRRAQQRALSLAADAMARSIVDWDLEWDGRPVPPTHAGLLNLDTVFLLALVTAWVEQVATHPVGVSAVAEPEQGPASALADVPMLDIPAEVDGEGEGAVVAAVEPIAELAG